MNPEDMLVQAWKQQLDAALGALEAIVEGATKVREVQLEATTEAHAAVVATRKAIAAATEAQQLMQLQVQWVGTNLEKASAYWRTLQEAAMETYAEVLQRLPAPAPVALPDALKAADVEASKQALLGMMDGAYKIERSA